MKKSKFDKPNCIIAARKNSKRLRNKNILKIDGKSLIEIVIKKAKKSKIFDKIIVSTDSKKIAKIAKKCGAEVPFLRSKKLSDDKTGTGEVAKDFILKIIQTNVLNLALNLFLSLFSKSV